MASKAHCTAHIVHVKLLGQEINNRVLCVGVKLGRICVSQSANVSCKCHDCQLESKANSKIGYVAFPCVVGRTDDALASPFSKAPWCQYPVKVFQSLSSTHQPFCQCLHQNAVAHGKC